MAPRNMRTFLAATIVALLVVVSSDGGGAMAQSECSNVLASLSPCLDYIKGNSSTASSACCTQLASVVKSQAQCLCQIINGGGSSFGISINQTRALELPKSCNVPTPSVTNCNATSPSASGTPSGPSASNNTPSVGSEGWRTKLAFPQLLIVVVVVSVASIFTTLV